MSRTRDLRQFKQSPQLAFPSSSSAPGSSEPEPEPADYSPQPRHPVRPSNSSHERPLRPQASRDGLGQTPPLRPQRNAARQPGIVVSNGLPNSFHGTQDRRPSASTSHSSHSHDRYGETADYIPRQGLPLRGENQAGPRDRLGNHNRLYQAVSGRRNEGSDSVSADPSRSDPNENSYLKEDYRARRDPYNSAPYDDQQSHLDNRRSRTSSDGSFDPDRNADLLSANELQGVRQNHGARNVLKVFAESASGSSTATSRSRRPAVADQGFHAKPSKLVDQSYPMTPGFREIEQVLQRIKTVWERTGIAGAPEDEEEQDSQQDSPVPFSPVGLALDLLESENPDKSQSAKRAKETINQKGGVVPSLSSFLKLKVELEKALQLTIQTNYRQFDASVNAYNLARANVDNSCKKVLELKSRLTECRTALGCRTGEGLGGAAGGKGTELKALRSRRDMLGEMLKLIDLIDQLKQVPERLESLISSKNFVSATVLLVRSLKLINKPELAEIGGLTDLRAYFVNQETVLFEILIEELHNHLYLKSYFCDSRWRVYRKGQTECTPATSHITTFPSDLSQSTKRKARTHMTSSLQQFLDDLMTKPPSNPLLDEPDLFLEMNSSSAPSDKPEDTSTSPVTHRVLSYSTLDSKKRKLQNANPELNSFSYIESLVESLAVLGKLSLGLDGVLQRAPLEIYNFVEATLHEVEERHANAAQVDESLSKTLGQGANVIDAFMSNRSSSLTTNILLQSAVNASSSKRTSVFKINVNELKEIESVSEILQDFFWTLFSKLDATLQSFRVLHEVSFRISERKGFKEDGMKSTNDLFSLLEVWKPIQSEVRALIHDYLTDLGDTGFGSGHDVSPRRNPIVSIAEVLKLNIGGSSTTVTNINASWKDPNKQLFKFKDTDLKLNNKDLKQHESNLDFALKVSVPGLVFDSTTINNNAGSGILLTTGLLNDETGSNRTGGSHGNGTHRLLVKPDAFHITLLLKPTLEFLVRAKEVLPNGVIVSMSLTQFHGFNNFLDEFVLHTFLPQLEEKVVTAFEQAINAPDAFQEDANKAVRSNASERGGLDLRRNTLWQLPVAKSMTTLITLIEGLCEMLQTMPFHQEKYGRLIVSIVVQYYQKCHERFKELVSRELTETTTTVDELNPYANLKLAADWAQRSELSRCLQDLEQSLVSLRKLFKKQFQLEEKFLETDKVSLIDLIQSPKKITALCNLYSSLDCFVTFTRTLSSSIQTVASPEGEGSGDDPPEPSSPLQLLSSNTDLQPKSGFRLPLTPGILRRFQMAQSSFRSLAQTILFTLHLELRLQAYHHLGKTSRSGQYFLSPSDSTEPDPCVIELNSLVSSSEAALTPALSESQRRFVILGFGYLLNRLLINTVLKLRIGNEYGFQKMYKNVLALQQNMKTLKSGEFDDERPEDGVGYHDRSMHADFERSRKFWEMASKGPDAVMASVRSGANYGFEHFRHLLCLLCMINPNTTTENVVPAEVTALDDDTWSQTKAANSPGFDKRKRTYNECLIELHALVLDDDEEEEEEDES
ncbi:hypothetical protein CROQUDRAFT_46818 [Cronartium quercuum f. sp. fusiforme G11]|uniref:Exocyst complex component Sec8 n=1 Tax=Cronartium quercuum f. sp. fusiforme G11 TaxID=708437 RepID=A0A9P6TAL9_9BASI|nr:hypothetical protein CROQUDRAFT_46818 [Cronartium quercuum f. sp. fusiforme G11]